MYTEDGDDLIIVTSRARPPRRRRRLWPIVVANYVDFAVYEQRTTRDIPVIVLSPA